MTEKKMTKREYLTRILSYAHEDDVVFLEHELELLARKNSAERKPTARQTENEGFKADVVAFMQPEVDYLLADLIKAVPSVVAAGLSPNRLTAIMTQLVNAGTVIRTTDKRKSVYRLA